MFMIHRFKIIVPFTEHAKQVSKKIFDIYRALQPQKDNIAFEIVKDFKKIPNQLAQLIFKVLLIPNVHLKTEAVEMVIQELGNTIDKCFYSTNLKDVIKEFLKNARSEIIVHSEEQSID